jgi:hypothetical protein
MFKVSLHCTHSLTPLLNFLCARYHILSFIVISAGNVRYIADTGHVCSMKYAIVFIKTILWFKTSAFHEEEWKVVLQWNIHIS